MRGALLYLMNLIEQGKKEALEKQNNQDLRFFNQIEAEIQQIIHQRVVLEVKH